ncbi:glutamate--cysteine ligase [Undibacterium seohonense]|jgi:glutamate--cysteine ligase|uniref:Glutamate--cysteine ligase n=1 Tax=Undibacterium seohonense TaxID=1344950 RepID=A0ABR6X2H4_9BURK|nr:glutamate--cysteine ligase [Undibacterium seohonense]MBC3807155.1 glutamate--cysteine ligase [Undibacterium seohonense]
MLNLDSHHSDLLKQRLQRINTPEHLPLLQQGLRGIERETLRVDRQGHLMLTPHPPALGAALTNPLITTDYSESLLEFITPAEQDISIALDKLDAIHRFAYSKFSDEMLWNNSMPCELPEEKDIPIAWYGTSHIGMIKHVYRRGLALRYGKSMQCIAGIHYNYSLSEDLWKLIADTEGDTRSHQDFQSESYIGLIRNFHRYSWLLMYLFGASPALSKSFLHGRQHNLESLSEDTLYLPYATSLRMSDLGYQNNVQDGLVPPYNNLLEYMRSLSLAVRKPYPPYAELGIKKDGEWMQINSNVLQIENEFYATIRPKRVIKTAERPVEALCARGVQYIEVRCMDVDPFEALGINLSTSRFLDAFLLFCALDESPLTNDIEGQENLDNFALTVKYGRQPGLMLQQQGKAISLQTWGNNLLEKIRPLAALLDQQSQTTEHQTSLSNQLEKLRDPDLTPSARVLEAIKHNNHSFPQFALAQSQYFAEHFKSNPPSSEMQAYFEQLARNSITEQTAMELNQTGSFDDFIEDYRSRTSSQICCDGLS